LRKSLLCLVLVLGLASAAFALPDHEAQYLWMYDPTGVQQPYGTIVDQLSPTNATWTIGHVSNDSVSVAQVREKFWILGEDLSQFSWTVWNDEQIGVDPIMIPGTIDSFHIRSMGYDPIPQDWDSNSSTAKTIADSPAGWTFTHDGTYYIWERDTGAGIGPGASLNNMQVVVPTTLWEISNGAIDWETVSGQEVIAGGDGWWRASHPGVPEPSSMLLLGMGLFGLVGGAFRKRFKA
jgi:hypothetical protein